MVQCRALCTLMHMAICLICLCQDSISVRTGPGKHSLLLSGLARRPIQF